MDPSHEQRWEALVAAAEMMRRVDAAAADALLSSPWPHHGGLLTALHAMTGRILAIDRSAPVYDAVDALVAAWIEWAPEQPENVAARHEAAMRWIAAQCALEAGGEGKAE